VNRSPLSTLRPDLWHGAGPGDIREFRSIQVHGLDLWQDVSIVNDAGATIAVGRVVALDFSDRKDRPVAKIEIAASVDRHE
jgi:hypothetical protein